nr:acyl-CoA dehydrogenase family protein [Pseudomonas sp. R5(2019)]
MIERARALIPSLKARAAQADLALKIPDETIADMQEAGLFRALQPERFGGFEVDLRTFFEIQMTLAEGCMSTAWIYGVMGVHPWQLARYPEQAQQDVWGQDSSTLVSSTYMPVAKVTPVEGGYRVSGRWGFSSGSEHCQWCLLGGVIPADENGQGAEHGTFLLPRSDYRIERNWEVLGLRGTGSHDIVVEDVFVPAHRVQRTNNTAIEATPGRQINTNPLYAIPFAQVFSRAVSTSAIGALQAAINEFSDNAARHIGKHGAKTAEDPVAQDAVADAVLTLDMLKLVLERNYDALLDTATQGAFPDVKTRLLYRYQSAYVTNICAEKVNTLLRCMAASGLYNSNPVARLFRDLHQARGHIANNVAAYGRSFGAVQLGLPNPDPYV